jgi:ankyrin repeat protein
MLEKGVELDTESDILGRTPLSWATANRHEAMVKLLLEKGAKLDHKTKHSLSPSKEVNVTLRQCVQ